MSVEELNENEVVESEETNAVGADGLSEITAKTQLENGGSASASFRFDFKGTTEAAAEAFGSEVVYNCYVRAATIDAQAVIRGLLKSGKSAAEVTAYMESNWFPGASRDNSGASLLTRYMKLSEEERLEFLAEIESMAKG